MDGGTAVQTCGSREIFMPKTMNTGNTNKGSCFLFWFALDSLQHGHKFMVLTLTKSEKAGEKNLSNIVAITDRVMPPIRIQKFPDFSFTNI